MASFSGAILGVLASLTAGHHPAAMSNYSLNWPAGRAPHFELATSAAASYFRRYATWDPRWRPNYCTSNRQC